MVSVWVHTSATVALHFCHLLSLIHFCCPAGVSLHNNEPRNTVPRNARDTVNSAIAWRHAPDVSVSRRTRDRRGEEVGASSKK